MSHTTRYYIATDTDKKSHEPNLIDMGARRSLLFAAGLQG